MTSNRFLLLNPENEKYNQYWYSKDTIQAVIDEIDEQYSNNGLIAFISTPSLFFSMKDKSKSILLDIDPKWKNTKGFIHYDFNKPRDIPKNLFGACSFIVIDPPFITYEVRFLLLDVNQSDCKILVSTIAENAEMMKKLLNLKPVRFKPSIPNLVYQYNFFCNYETKRLSKQNPEIKD